MTLVIGSPDHHGKSCLFEQECVGLFSEFIHVVGVPKSVGAIYGLLYSSPNPLCFVQIFNKLGMSKGSVSQGLAFLRVVGAIKTIRVSGDRREYFEPELSLRRLTAGLIKNRINPLIDETEAAVERLRGYANGGDEEMKRFQSERIEQLETWHRQLGRVLPVVQSILNISRR